MQRFPPPPLLVHLHHIIRFRAVACTFAALGRNPFANIILSLTQKRKTSVRGVGHHVRAPKTRGSTRSSSTAAVCDAANDAFVDRLSSAQLHFLLLLLCAGELVPLRVFENSLLHGGAFFLLQILFRRGHADGLIIDHTWSRLAASVDTRVVKPTWMCAPIGMTVSSQVSRAVVPILLYL